MVLKATGLLLEGAGKARRAPGERSGKPVYTQGDLRSKRSPQGGPKAQGKLARVRRLAGHVPGYQLGGTAANWNLGYWPCPFFTSTSTDNNDTGDFQRFLF